MVEALWKSEPNDRNLVEYLAETRNFQFLSEKTYQVVRELRTSERKEGLGFGEERKTLLRLWPLVLTDALMILKKHDTREWTQDSGIDFDSFFNRESLGVDQFKSVVEGFADFENLLYGASPQHHRDHVAHSFRVWILGQLLLMKALKGKLHVATGTRAQDELAIKDIELQCMWAMTALCHDIGYPFSKVDEINKKATDTLQAQGLRSLGNLRFSFSSEMQPFYQTVMSLMASSVVEAGLGGEARGFLTHVQNKYYMKFLMSCDRLEHGVISALLMAKSLVYFLESDQCLDSRRPLSAEDARQFLIRREILRAVASHTCQEIYHLKFNTLSFLLFIVDELQCWGRPTLEQLQLGEGNFGKDSVTISVFKPDAIDIEIESGAAWDDEQVTQADRVLSGINRRLRLAVDAKDYKGLYLRFLVSGRNGKGREMILQDGRITRRGKG